MVYCNNPPTIHLSKHPLFHNKSKHIDVKFYFIRDDVIQYLVKINKIVIEDNFTDMLIKTLLTTKFYHCMNFVRVKTN